MADALTSNAERARNYSYASKTTNMSTLCIYMLRLDSKKIHGSYSNWFLLRKSFYETGGQGSGYDVFTPMT